MKLLGSTGSKITNDKDGENVPYLEIPVVTLVQCSIVNNNYQQRNSRVLYRFVRNKSFGQLLEISSTNFIYWKTFNSEFSYIDV